MHLGTAVPKALLMCFLFTLFINTSLPVFRVYFKFFFSSKGRTYKGGLHRYYF